MPCLEGRIFWQRGKGGSREYTQYRGMVAGRGLVDRGSLPTRQVMAPFAAKSSVAGAPNDKSRYSRENQHDRRPAVVVISS